MEEEEEEKEENDEDEVLLLQSARTRAEVDHPPKSSSTASKALPSPQGVAASGCQTPRSPRLTALRHRRLLARSLILRRPTPHRCEGPDSRSSAARGMAMHQTEIIPVQKKWMTSAE